ncbi:hypothetical protein DFH07DRAFT_944577 [Mycena maculata]|uniref:PWWP domain-containing protein n=1 Tax=Mycena maculata TaxID=230809 RepID=A0AAD7I700_9AGAR|nr:hypothetical protein DFH07DRAFT_944577 [Mycena maculata]
MSTSRGSTRQAAKKASTKFEAQLMSSPVKSPVKQDKSKPAKRASSRPNFKTQDTALAKLSAALSRPGARKRAISLDSRRSDTQESDLTSLSASSTPPKPKTAPSSTLVDMDYPEYVWVLLDFKGQVFGLHNEDDGVPRIWWPAHVLSNQDSRYRVKLFGRIGALKHGAVLELDAPHAGSVASIANDDDRIRYTAPEYVVSAKETESPKKRQKLDRSALEAQWYAALSAAVGHIMKNEMPDTRFLSSMSHIVTSEEDTKEKLKKKGKGKEVEELSYREPWSPPPPDSSLDIPGEHILARDKKSATVYWPATILSYIPPTRAGAEKLYHILWMDQTQSDIPRSLFYTYEDDAFGTCPLGSFESVFQEVVNDDEDEEAPARGRTRSSPEPRNPPPSAREFEELSVHEQFVYTKPVLQAILRDEYAPAQEVNQLFIAGGNGRKQVVEAAGERGLMDPRDVERFQGCLLEWCLRKTGGEVREREAEEDGDVELPGVGAEADAKEPVVEEPAGEEPVNEAETADEAKATGSDETPAVETSTESAAVDAVLFAGEARDSDDTSAAVDAVLPTSEASAPASDDTPAVDTNTDSVADAALPPASDDPMGGIDPALQVLISVFLDRTQLIIFQEHISAPVSPADTVRDSSPALPPPSSSFSGIESDVPMEVEDADESTADGPAATTDMDDIFDTSSTLTDASDVSDLIPPPRPPRQIGCPAYEGLSTVEKMDYCLNVLLPQLIIQILLWRTGQRRSVALLTPARESDLNERGRREKARTDWVFDVKRLRAQKERELQKSETIVGGTTSRPKKGRR